MRQSEPVVVIGAGLAGTECAYQLARRGIAVHLYEMRPQKETPAHTGPFFSELVCSNSFGSDAPFSASRILKDELALLGSLTLEVAREFSVPAGASLAVDREKFSRAMTAVVESLPGVTVFRQEVPEIPKEGIVVLATGPLTSPSLCESLKTYLGGQSLYFYDAISPIVSKESLDLDQMYFANRYGKGETPDFLNIPLEKSHYEELIQDLLTSEVVLPHDFEEEKYFEGCMPIEALAARGPKTLAFGPMKPVGLENPRTGKRPYAVIQLRTENRHGTAYNLVGFQTKLRYKEQERVFRKLPGMANAEFLRLGCMHRNTYIHSPSELNPTLQMRRRDTLFIAGQLTGTEGYLESSAGGLIAGRNAADLVLGKVPRVLPENSMLGALLLSITDASKTNFQPSNVNFGLMPPLEEPIRDKKLRNERYGLRSVAAIEEFLKEEESLKAFSLGDYKPASASLP